MTTARRLRLTLRQPAQISDRARADFVLGTQAYLPGWVVRGAFAARWLARHDGPADPGTPAREEFLRLFEGAVRFGPLFTGAPPQPLSVLVHKYPHTDACPHVEIDRAVSDATAQACPACESPWEPAKGDIPEAATPHRRTHVTISEAGVAARRGLVSRETLPAGLSFAGTVAAADAGLLDILAGFADVHVGGRRTTHGLAETDLAETDLADAAPPQPTRLPDGRLVITLRSPGVFVDGHGRPAQEPNVAELTKVLGAAASVERRWVRWTTVGGWHAASGLPKPTELAVAAGSTYRLTVASPVDDAALAALAVRGLGLRRHEGFGDIGGAAVLPAGRVERDRQAEAFSKLASSVAALRRHQTSRLWPELALLLRAAVLGDRAAADRLGRVASSWRPAERQALQRLLDLRPAVAARILDSWR